jgi:SagB-type dehydrogenase family enzyme
VGNFVSWKEPRQIQGLDTKEITELVIKESRLQECHLHHRPANLELPSVAEPRNAICKLPRGLQDGASLISVLEGRRSVRRFENRPIDLRHLGTAIRLAHEADRRSWLEDDKAGPSLDFVVLAKRVLGLDPGVYEYEASAHGLAQLRRALSEAELSALLVQTEFVDAACIIWITGDLRTACSRHGAFGHRQLLLRAGAAGHALWMCLLSFGLGGSLMAGLVPGAARDIIGLDGYRKASLFAAAVGYGANDSTGEAN